MIYYVSKSGNNANPGTQDKPLSTLSKAISIASNGDSIVVAAGVYSEQVTVSKQVTILGADSDKTIFDGLAKYPLIIFSGYTGLFNVTANNVSISGISIVRSRAFGLYANGISTLSLSDVSVRDCYGSGIYTIAVSGLDIANSDISNIHLSSTTLVKSDRQPAALEVRDCAGVSIYQSTISKCDNQGIGVIETENIEIEDCDIFDTFDAQIYLDGADTCTVNACAVYYTSAVQSQNRGTGIKIARNLYPLIYGASPNTIVPNVDIYITNNIVDGCKHNLTHSGGFATVYEEFTDSSGKTSVVAKTVPVPGYTWNNVNIINNTFVNGLDGIVLRKDNSLFEYGTSGDVKCTFSNNIVHVRGSTSLYWSPKNISTYEFSNCLFSVAPPLLQTFNSITGAENILIGAPGLSNGLAVIGSLIDTDGYMPLVGSRAIDAADETVATFTDFFGNDRDTPDIGAVEYISESGAPVLPVASFAQSATRGQAPLRVDFTDTTQVSFNITSWLWSFGDGGSSSDRNPSHVYKTPGTYSVSLSVTSIGGSTGTVTKSNLITVTQSDTTLPPQATSGRVAARYARGLFPAASGTVTVPHNLPYTPDVVFVHGRAASSATAGGQAVMMTGCVVKQDDISKRNTGGIGSMLHFSSPDTLGQSALFGADVSFYNINTSRTELVHIDWDETNIYISSGSVAPSYSLVLDMLAVGGPDVKVALDEVSLTVTNNIPDNYISDNLGFKPDIVVAYKDPVVYIADIATPGYKHGVGFYAADGTMSSIVFGHDLSGSAWDMEARSASDRLLNWDSGSLFNGGISVELNNYGYRLWSTVTHPTNLHVLAVSLGGVPCTVVDLLAQSAPTSNMLESYELGFEPQAIMGMTTWLTAQGYTGGEPAEAHGQFMADSHALGHMASYGTDYSTSNYGSIGGDTIELDVPNETEYVGANISLTESGVDVTSLAGTNVDGARMPALVIGAGATGEVVPGFSLNQVSGLTGSVFMVNNLAYSASSRALVYYYTDGDGNTYYDKEPEISYSAAGIYTITQYVSPADDLAAIYSYTVSVSVSDTYAVPVINVDYGTVQQSGAIVGSPLLVSNATVLQAGQSILFEQWSVVKVSESGRESTVATSLTSPFYFSPTVEANYYISLTMYLSDGTRGSSTLNFRAVNNPGGTSRISMAPVVARKPTGSSSSSSFVAPATLLFTDDTDYGTTDVISRQYVFAPSDHKGRLDIYKYIQYASEPVVVFSNTTCISSGDSLKYTFTESGLYTVAMIVQTSTNVNVAYYKDFINITPAESIAIGPLVPDTIGAYTMNVVDGIGAHTHAIEVTTTGEPLRIVATDNYGDITARKFKTTDTELSGELSLNGPDAKLSADTLRIQSSAIVPMLDNADIGTQSDRFGSINSSVVSAGNISRNGEVGAIGGSLATANSYILRKQMLASDASMTVDNQEGLATGDYVLFASSGVVEIAKVASSPRSTSGDTAWTVALLRGSSLGDGYIASSWPSGVSCINIGGSGSVGDINIESWLELHTASRIISGSVIDKGEDGPGISGYLRVGNEPGDVVPYFLTGHIAGMYGLPSDISAIGTAIGTYNGESMCIIVHDDIIEFKSKDGDMSMSISDAGGLRIIIGTGNDSAKKLISVIRDDGSDVFTFVHDDDIMTKLSSTSIISRPRPGWDTLVSLVGESSNGQSASVTIESAWGANPVIKLDGLPASDPVIANALWNSAGTVKISSG